MKKKIILLCATVLAIVVFTGTIVSFATSSNVFYEAGQFLKEALQKRADSNDENILAIYDGTPITKDIVLEAYTGVNSFSFLLETGGLC